MASHRRVIIASVPEGPLEPGHFAVQSVPSPECGEGEVLCRRLKADLPADLPPGKYLLYLTTADYDQPFAEITVGA